MATRRRKQISMCRAFIEVFWSRGDGKEKKQPRHTNLRGDTGGRIITGRFKEQKERGAQEEEKCEIQVPKHCSSLQNSTENLAYTSNIPIGWWRRDNRSWNVDKGITWVRQMISEDFKEQKEKERTHNRLEHRIRITCTLEQW